VNLKVQLWVVNECRGYREGRRGPGIHLRPRTIGKRARSLTACCFGCLAISILTTEVATNIPKNFRKEMIVCCWRQRCIRSVKHIMHHHQCLINLPVNMGPPFSNGMGIINQLIYSDPFTITMSGQLLLLYDPCGGVCCVNYLRLHINLVNPDCCLKACACGRSLPISSYPPS